MTITYYGHAANPADSATVKFANPDAPLPITPPAGMTAGDLVFVIVAIRDVVSLSVSNAGGQTWTTEAEISTGSVAHRRFWCTFNGTWSANPTFTASYLGTYAKMSAVMLVFRPSGSPTWAVDVAQAENAVTPLSSPWDVTATGQTAIAASTVSIATWVSTVPSPPVAALQTGGWTNPDSQTQWRNTNGTSTDLIVCAAYKIQTSAGATGNVVNRLTGVATNVYWTMQTLKDQSAGPAFYQYDWPHQLHARR